MCIRDSKSGVEVMTILQELNSQGITVVVVTHDARVARHAQRVIHVRDGSVVLNECVTDRIIAEKEIASIDRELAVDDIEAISVNVRPGA